MWAEDFSSPEDRQHESQLQEVGRPWGTAESRQGMVIQLCRPLKMYADQADHMLADSHFELSGLCVVTEYCIREKCSEQLFKFPAVDEVICNHNAKRCNSTLMFILFISMMLM